MNIELKKIEIEDLELLRKWRMQENVTKYMLTNPIITQESQLEWFNKISHDNSRQDYVIIVDQTKIGYYGITNIDKELSSCEIGFYIGEECYRGKGIFKVVQNKIENIIFYELKLNKVIINVLSDNPIIDLYKKNGFFNNCALNKVIYKNNKLCKVVSLYKIKDNGV